MDQGPTGGWAGGRAGAQAARRAAGLGPSQLQVNRMQGDGWNGDKDSGRDDVAGITLPPAGSGRTFRDGCFFSCQREDRREVGGGGGEGEERERKSCVNLLFSEGMAFYPRKTFCPTNGPCRSIQIGGGFRSWLCH